MQIKHLALINGIIDARFFESGSPKLNPEDLENVLTINDLEQVAGGGIGVTDPAKKPSGMHCPQCGEFIQFSIEDIIKKSIAICPHCGLHIRLTESGPVIEA